MVVIFLIEMSLVDFGCVSKRETLIGLNQLPFERFQIESLIFDPNFPFLVSILLV